MEAHDIEEILHRVLDERGLDRKTHMEHHRFVEYLLEKEEKREARREKFVNSFIGGVALLVLSGLIWLGRIIWQHLPHS